MAYRLTSTAEEQLDALLLDSARDHGLVAAGRYAELLLTVMAALGDQPRMLGSIEVPGLTGIRAFPSRLARRRLMPERRVGKPRHLIVYREASDGLIEILGVVHDRMVLSRAAAKIVRANDEH